MKLVLAAALATVLAAPAWAAATPKLIGTWFVSNDKDAFSDKETDIAFTPDEGGSWLLALRCLNDQPSMLLMAGPRTEDDLVRTAAYSVKFRADKGNVTSLVGYSLQDKGLEIELSPETFKSIQSAGMFAMRFTTEKSDDQKDLTFTPKMSKAALTTIGATCKLN